VPYLAELDHHPGAVSAGRQLLIVRPLEVLHGGHRYAVALRDLKDADGRTIEPGPAFSWYRGDRAGGRESSWTGSASRTGHSSAVGRSTRTALIASLRGWLDSPDG
jgi:hypothetical protein